MPVTGSVVNVNVSPLCSSIFPSANVPMRYSGPFVSSMMAMGRSSSARSFLMRSMRT